MEAFPTTKTIKSPSLDDSYDTKHEDPSQEDIQPSSCTVDETRSKAGNEEDKAIKKRSKKAASRKAAQTNGNYNRHFLSNFKIEHLFSFNRKHAHRLTQDEVGLILSDASAFEKLQSYLRQEGCVTDGTIRVNYNDLLRSRLREIKEYQEENKEEFSDSGSLRGSLDEDCSITCQEEVEHIPETSSENGIDLATERSEKEDVSDSECITPSKERNLHDFIESESSDSPRFNSSISSKVDEAQTSNANSSPTSVLDLMDLEMKEIDQAVENFENDEAGALYNREAVCDDDDFADTSSVDSGLFVENRTFDRPAVSEPVIARPWGKDSASTKEEKIWDICAVEAPATTMDFDYLWEDESHSESDTVPYRSKSCVSSSSDDDTLNEDPSLQSKESSSERNGSIKEVRWRSPLLDAAKSDRDMERLECLLDQKKQPETSLPKKGFSYPLPAIGIPGDADTIAQTDDDVLRLENVKIHQKKPIPLARKRITRRQKRLHVIETLEI